MSRQVILSILSADQPGIIADVTTAIYELGGDLADLRQSVLYGYFNMTVVSRFSKENSIDEIIEKIKSMSPHAKLEITGKEIPVDSAGTRLPEIENDYVVTAQGRNRTGLVAAVATFCKERGINIIDFDSRLEHDIYSMILEIDLTDADAPEAIRAELEEIAKKVGLTIIVQNKKLFETIVAVGTLIAQRPPHRSGREELRSSGSYLGCVTAKR